MEKERYHLLDSIRALALINMIAYHALYDIVYIFGVRVVWYMSPSSDIWQQFICCTFILLSGFCWNLDRKKLKRALLVLGGSVVITLVTYFFMPDQIIKFGVLSLIGTGMLIMIPLDKVYKKINPYLGFLVTLFLFITTRNIGNGGIGFFDTWFTLPRSMYVNDFTAFLGFPSFGFRSADYFPLLPWIFLYQAGYFLFGIFVHLGLMKYLKAPRIKPLEWIGRHSLIIYMLHQPMVYGVLWLIFSL